MATLLFEGLTTSARLYPRKTALKHGSQQLSYAALDHHSDRLADLLLDQGLTPGYHVALLIEKSIPALVAIFGILKAGGCYVPLDGNAPSDRLADILMDCQAQMVICSDHPSILAKLTAVQNAGPTTLIRVHQEKKQLRISFTTEPLNPSIPAAPTAPQALTEKSPAFILYAPGEDGRPRGARYLHSAGVAYVTWARDYFQISEEDVFACQGPLHFVISIFDIYTSIWAGATLCLVTKALSLFPASLAQLLDEEKITTWFSVPSILVPLVKHGDLTNRNLSHLRRILFGGEVFPPTYLQQLTSLLPQVLFYNVYGRTETNVCLVHDLDTTSRDPSPLPLGRPCAGTATYLLDQDGRPSPDRLDGELGIQSPAMMNGYVNDDTRNKACFISHPDRTGEQIYRTGDWVALDPEQKHYTFQGRRDQMFKIRGNRVETTEVEMVLNHHPRVHQSVVHSRVTREGFHYLRAFIRLNPGPPVPESQLQAFCKHKLPNYMIPDGFTFLDRFPNRADGKIDLTALLNYVKN